MTVVTEGKTVHNHSFSIPHLFLRAFVLDLYFLSNLNIPETSIGIAFLEMVFAELNALSPSC